MNPKLSIIAVLALSCAASEAGAQAARPWTEPDGAFTVTIPDGWAEVTYSEAPAGTLLIIGSASMRQSPDDYFRECFIHHKPMPNAPSTQAELNARGAEATPQDVFRGRPVESFKKETRSGVLVTNGIWTERGVWEMHSIFALATRNGPVLYTLACGATGGDEAGKEIVAMSLFLESVAFHP
jgi:hypothetical protein